MYEVSVKRNFIAQHHLMSEEWGIEDELHSNHYQIELVVSGNTLDRNGYLIDIIYLENILDHLVARYRNRTLNDFEEFKDVNPSIENIARTMCDMMADEIKVSNVHAITLRIWENQIAWGSYTKIFS
ncbi:6-carboxytetrahydropterin synthase [candidate division KSB1 bacterium]|nr:6-carboxytetrahydropterin synthase [candidate division KSB1 bacterium]